MSRMTMARWAAPLLAATLASPAAAESLYLSPDVPTTLGATTYLASDVIRYDAGVHSLEMSLPPGASVDALFRRDDGRWLFSFDAAVQLDAVTYDPYDVVLYDGMSWSLFFDGGSLGVPANAKVDAVFMEGGDAGDPVVSFDVPVTIRGMTFLPADLVRFTGVIPSPFLDGTSTTPPIPITSNVTGADRRGGLIVLTFDVPTTLGTSTYLPGELVSWNGTAFASHLKDPAWPAGSRVDAFSFLADPGEVPSLDVAPSAVTPGDLTISWTHSCSVGAEDYAIYEGVIGDWYGHKSIDCSDDGGDFVEEITPAAGDRYYLIVPLNANDEGSYGTMSSGTPRPPGAVTCVATQALSSCP
jgi:hypothetical protein